MKGKTYSLRADSGSSEEYYRVVAELANRLLDGGMPPVSLLEEVRRASGTPSRASALLRSPGSMLAREVDAALSRFTEGADWSPMRACPRGLGDPILRTSRRRHHLDMLEIELVNRINRKVFARSPWRMALIAHCLRDHHGTCAAAPGDIEEECAGCRPECLVRLAGEIARRRDVHSFIAASMDHDSLFRGLAERHPGMAVMGVACVPELAMGLRLVEGLGIPAVGVPLDANRCARWCGGTLETSFSLEEMERLMGPDGPGGIP